MNAITVTNLGKAYKKYPNRWSRLKEWLDPCNNPRHEQHWVLQDINFIIAKGQSVGIMGINGAGKSTLLKMITGTTRPTTGKVQIHGRVAALLELGTGFHPEFTGRQNAYMAGQLLGYSFEEITRLMPEIAAFSEIGDYIDQPVRVYSSGMQIRLAFSVATASRPDILIVDEALSVGDSYFQSKCYSRINSYKENGMALLLVSHSPEDIVKHCERAIFLKNGRVEIDGTSRIVTNFYLDSLFGKKSDDIKGVEMQVPVDSSLDLNSYDDDYHTRIGYNSNEHRWGLGGAAIIDYVFATENDQFPTKINSGDVVSFRIKVRFDCDYDSVVPGFLIKTIEGVFLYGTNSLIAKDNLDFINVCAGDIRIFNFRLPLTLNEGNYLVSFGVSSGCEQSELKPLDRRYDSILINVAATARFWGMVDLQAEFLEQTEL